MKKSFIGIAIAMGLLVIALVGCGKNEDNGAKGIVGVWKNDTAYAGYEFVYTFNEDGTGNYNSAGTDMPFTYKTSGDDLSILYDGNTVSFDTKYEIKGNVLNVKDSNNQDTLYDRVND